MLKMSSVNRGFIIPALIFFILGTISLISTSQGDGLKFCADNRTDFWNAFFIYGTQLGEEPVYAILTILGLFISFRFAIKIPIIGFSIMGLSYFLKGIFQHKRPWTTYWEQQSTFEEFNLIEGVHVLSGLSSFPSGHTMSGFGLFYLLSLHFNKKISVGVLCFLIALIVGLSRIYLFQHFIKDVLAGAILGIIIAQVIDYVCSYKKNDADFFLNKNLFQLFKKKIA